MMTGLPTQAPRMYPAGRLGEPEDIAAAIVFPAGKHASWITARC